MPAAKIDKCPASLTHHSKKPRWLAVGIGALLLLLIAVSLQKVFSADLWWQIKNGQWILEHGKVPREEFYSFTARGTPLREMRWLYCIAIAQVWRIGEWAPSLLQALLVGSIWTVVVWPLRRTLNSPIALLAIALGLVAGFARWVMRPELVSYLMAATFLAVLESHRTSARAGKPGRLIWLIPLLQMLWVNCHSTFLFGPVLVAGFAFGDAVERWLARRRDPALPRLSPPLFVTLALSIAACWLNPYGHWGAMYAVQMYRETSAGHATQRLIMEMKSPLAIPLSAWGWDFFAAAALLVLGALSFLHLAVADLRRPQHTSEPLRTSLIRLGIWGMATYLFIMLQRNTPLAAVLGAWVVLCNVRDTLADPRAWPTTLTDRREGRLLHAGVCIASAATAWMIATDRYAVSRDLPREFGVGIVEWYQPRGAEAFLLHERPKGNLFNVVRDGSYFIFRVADTLPVFIDGRTDAYGPAIFEEFAAINGSNFAAAADKWTFNTAVVPNRGYEDVVQALAASPDWALVHLDPVSLAFVRRIPEHESLIARATPAAKMLTAADIDDRAPSWKRAFGGVGRPWYTLGMAESLLSIGAPVAAEPYLALAVERFPDNARARSLLAPMREAAGDLRASSMLLAGLPEEVVLDARQEAARLLMNAGKLKEAVSPLEAVVAGRPEDRAVRIVLADLYLQTGNAAAARDHYSRALANTRGVPGDWNKLGTVCEQLGDGTGAIRAYEQSLAIDPKQHTTWNALGAMYARAENFARARDCFERSLALKPDFAPAQRNMDRLRSLNAGGR